MTTAAHPTWSPAKDGNEQGGSRIFGRSQKYSLRDIASHTTFKPRKEEQDTRSAERNLRGRRHLSSRDDRDRRKGSSSGHLLLEDADGSDMEVKSDESDSDDDDDDEDDTEALLAELEQIKKEWAEEKLRKLIHSWNELLSEGQMREDSSTKHFCCK
ncbi:hypothetical protein AQUCO_00600134v1 [Aquilegia coerulea]|uniref:Uncharacterized protein n=1 Tax=Aquilegia coerulea TaxID=218851 RepID=A0A2G5ENB1_AQUCA|nr:hypothetical protein AQUCO_00600134v1 [Aquilegia coerulea]